MGPLNCIRAVVSVNLIVLITFLIHDQMPFLIHNEIHEKIANKFICTPASKFAFIKQALAANNSNFRVIDLIIT